MKKDKKLDLKKMAKEFAKQYKNKNAYKKYPKFKRDITK